MNDAIKTADTFQEKQQLQSMKCIFFYAAQSHFVSHNTNTYNLSINGRLCCQPASFPHTV